MSADLCEGKRRVTSEKLIQESQHFEIRRKNNKSPSVVSGRSCGTRRRVMAGKKVGGPTWGEMYHRGRHQQRWKSRSIQGSVPKMTTEYERQREILGVTKTL